MDLQDDSIQELTGTLREMLATANMIPVTPNTTDVIVDISRQSLRVASLIHEFTKLPLAGDSLLYPVKLFFCLTIVFRRANCRNPKWRFKITC